MTFLQTRPSVTSFKLSAFYFFYFGAVGVYTVFLPHVLKGVGYSSFEIGAIFAVAPVMKFLVPFLFIRHVRLSRSLFAFSLVSAALLSFAVIHFLRDFWALFVCFAFMGAFWSVLLPFVEVIALEHKKEHYGRLRLFGSLGFVAASLLLARFNSHLDLTAYIYIGSIFLTMLFGLWLVPLSRTLAQRPAGRGFGFKRALGFWFFVFFLQLSFGGFYSFFTIYETQRGVSLVMISYFWAIAIAAEVAMFIWQGALLRRASLPALLQLAAIFTAVRWLMLYLWGASLFAVALSSALHAFSFALLHTASISYLSRVYPRAVSLAQQFHLGIGYGLGAFVGSLIAGAFYGDYLFLTMSLFALCGLLFFTLSAKRKI